MWKAIKRFIQLQPSRCDILGHKWIQKETSTTLAFGNPPVTVCARCDEYKFIFEYNEINQRARMKYIADKGTVFGKEWRDLHSSERFEYRALAMLELQKTGRIVYQPFPCPECGELIWRKRKNTCGECGTIVCDACVQKQPCQKCEVEDRDLNEVM